MNSATSEEPKLLSNELPEARVKEVAEAVGEALAKGDDGPKLIAVDPDGDTLQMAIETSVKKALSISPLKTLLKAWKGMTDVAELIGPDGPQDGKPRQVTIASHTLKAEFTPHIVIEFAKIVDVRKLPVPVTFSLQVEGLLITITDRRIVSVAAGRAKPAVTVKVEGVTIVKEKLPTIDLPVEMQLEQQEMLVT